MTHRQCEIAAESYTAYLLTQAGYDVLVQYGPNQPHYDLVAEKDETFLPISVKGSQDGGWMLAVKYKKKGVTYHDAIDNWLKEQQKDVIFVFVQFYGVALGDQPRVYIAKKREIAEYMKTQRDGKGYCSLQEDKRSKRPKGKYEHKVPDAWKFSQKRLNEVTP